MLPGCMQQESNLKLRLILPQIQPRSERAASPARPLTNGSLLRIINLMRNDRAGMEGSVGSRNVRLKITEIPPSSTGHTPPYTYAQQCSMEGKNFLFYAGWRHKDRVSSSHLVDDHDGCLVQHR